MMKKLLIAVTLLVVVPYTVVAQVEKQVEVTKDYVPKVADATKLGIVPDRTDTVKMRPEIDYAITPLSLQTTLTTRPIRPAAVTYWEFNRPLPFYLKVGAGYPLASVVDFYASSQNAGTGYVVGYVNHTGRYAKIGNEYEVKNTSTRLLNRIGAAAGKYFGRHTLEAELSYDNRLDHRYGGFASENTTETYRPGARILFHNAQARMRFGDDFRDLSRVNFEVAVHGDLFWSVPEIYGQWLTETESATQSYGRIDGKSRQTTWGASGKIAKAFGRHRLSFDVGYEGFTGLKMLDEGYQHQLRAGLRYGVDGAVVRFEVGADYYHDKAFATTEENYFIPFAHLYFDLGTPGLKPFLEVDGGVYANDYRALTHQNPYVGAAEWLNKSSVDYNGRFGLGGSLWHEKFVYRLFAAFSIHDNHIYWQMPQVDAKFIGVEVPIQARQTVLSFNGEVEYRPVAALKMTLGAGGYIYNDDIQLANGAPAFRANVGLRYEGRKISFGVAAQVQSERSWSCFDQKSIDVPERFTAPFAADLRVDFEWRLSGGFALFAEGRNLANQRLYEYAWYREYGANFMVGVKANF
ncbi:MAG: hypothetical protein RR270_00460 [Alistipes sp.]